VPVVSLVVRSSLLVLVVVVAAGAGCASDRGRGGGGGGGGDKDLGGLLGGDGGADRCATADDKAGCACSGVGSTIACYDGPAGTRGVGACRDGQQSCEATGEFFVYSNCSGAVKPATEVCTGGGDEDCDGLVDCADPDCVPDPACKLDCAPGQTQPCYSGPAGTSGVGQCKPGLKTCDANGHWGGCVGEVLPGSDESFLGGNCGDGIDNDCDGLKDCQEILCLLVGSCSPTVCSAGATQSCYTGPAGTSGVGLCHGGTQTCASDGKSWGPCTGQVLPSSEGAACQDGKDNDCNGKVDCADPACATAAACCVPMSGGGTVDETIWANSSTDLYRVDPTTFAVTRIGSFGVSSMTDIAVTPSGELYGITFGALYRIDKNTARATFVASLSGGGNNGLTFLTNGSLLASAGSGDVTSINPTTGANSAVGSFGNGLSSSGDLVAVGNVMYGISSTTAGGGDASDDNVLLTVDTATGRATVVGPIGFGRVWGLAYVRKKVIAFATSGQIIQIDPLTGRGTLLSTTNIQWWGAGMSPNVPVNTCP